MSALARTTIEREGVALLAAFDASTFLARLRGLHDLPPLGTGEALVIRPCRAVQSVGMDETIEVVFVDAAGVIVKLAPLAPGRFAMCLRARASVELAAGTIERLGLARGQRLTLASGGWR